MAGCLQATQAISIRQLLRNAIMTVTPTPDVETQLILEKEAQEVDSEGWGVVLETGRSPAIVDVTNNHIQGHQQCITQ
jgi:hypothetical protein